MRASLTAVLFACLFASHGISQTPAADTLKLKTLTRQQAVDDLDHLVDVFRETHPGLYRYTGKSDMDALITRIKSRISDSIPFYNFFSLAASYIAGIRCAHTYLTPVSNIEAFLTGATKMLPLEVMIIQGQPYVSLNGNTDTIVKPGDRLLSINGRGIKEIMEELDEHTWTDGYNRSAKASMMSGIKFPLFYYMLIEQPDSFHVQLETLKKVKHSITLPAKRFEEFYQAFFSNPVNKSVIEVNSERNKKDREHGWRVDYPSLPSTAILRINGFGGGESSEEAAKIIRNFLDSVMRDLSKNKISNLIVDLRNNGGGWDVQGVELFTYLAKDSAPVPYYRRKHSITDGSEYLKYSDLSKEDLANLKKELKPEPDGTFSVRPEYSIDMTLHPPKPNRFKGKIYFLMNGGSGSTTSEFLAVARSNNMGIFIGEESGGAYEGGNGGSFLHFNLANSGIAIGSPLLYYQNAVKPPKQKGRGTLPDHEVITRVEDMLTAYDRQMEYTFDLIRKSKH